MSDLLQKVKQDREGLAVHLSQLEAQQSKLVAALKTLEEKIGQQRGAIQYADMLIQSMSEDKEKKLEEERKVKKGKKPTPASGDGVSDEGRKKADVIAERILGVDEETPVADGN